MNTYSKPQNPPVPPGFFIAVGLVILLWGAWAGQAFLVPMFLSALVAFTAVPIVRILMRYHVPEWLAISLAAIVLLLPVAVLAAVLVHELQGLIADYPKLIASLQHTVTSFSEQSWAKHLGLSKQLRTEALADRLSNGAGESLQIVMHGLRTLLEMGSQTVLIFIFAVLMLASRTHLNRCFQKIFARWEGVEGGKLLDALSELIEKFLLTKLLVVVIIAIASSVLLRIFGVHYSVFLGVIVGVLTMIPEVGFVVSLIPILIVALASGLTTWSVVGSMLSMLGVHLIEANILTPKLVGHKLNLNALSTFVGLFAGGLLWGVWGMFLCVPILGILRIALSVSPNWQPWAELLSERDDSEVIGKLVSRRLRDAWKSAATIPWRRTEA